MKSGADLIRSLSLCLLAWALIQCIIPASMASELPEQPFEPNQSIAVPHEKKSSQNTDQSPLIIKDIKFQPETGKEQVLVFSTRFFNPSVLALEGEKPRFVIDIRNTDSVREGLKTIYVDGRFIKRIRTRHDSKSGIFRIVLDLNPEENYHVNQTFFEAENIYVIGVEPDRTRK